ncbi:hypothetical protein [Microcoleus sp. Pol12A5]|uniref:hypothetical protein n=1 Tax=Microcoleus sp. Pol12A5 TaxID=3055392 RepID=UPI002FD771ED
MFECAVVMLVEHYQDSHDFAQASVPVRVGVFSPPGRATAVAREVQILQKPSMWHYSSSKLEVGDAC